MDEFSATSRDELIDRLSSSDIAVPSLGSKGRKSQVERWSMFRLLSTISDDRLLAYPLKLVHKDKPDFRIHSETLTIGVEVTEAIPENLAKAVSIQNKSFPESFIDRSTFGWDTAPMSRAEIEGVLSKNSFSQNPWTGPESFDSQTRDIWGRAMRSCIEEKTQTLNSKDFAKYERNWLVIYDNLPGSGHLSPRVDNELNGLLDFVKTYFRGSAVKNASLFDTIFIETGDDFCCVDVNIRRKGILNLWQKHGN